MKNSLYQQLAVPTQAGFEPLLAKELSRLGAADIHTGNRIVHFAGSKEWVYKVNYLCRTALRVLVPFESFRIRSQDDFYNRSTAIPWENFFGLQQTFAIQEVVHKSVFEHTKFAALRLKDAIADRFLRKYRKRPNVDTRSPDVRIHLHMVQNEVVLSLDSSGEPLFKRGYRMQTGPAPINEITAAGLIQLSGWDAKSNLFDPMCGSGTFIIEAAMAAMNIPAGYYREGFGFENWPDFDQGLFDQVKREADDQISEMDCRITGSDFSPKMIDIALENLKKAHLHKDVELRKADFFNSNPAHKSGMLIFNPPYDLRMKNENIFQFYKSVGDKLKSDYQGYTAWIISGNHEALKNLGLKPSKKFMVYNGPVASQFACYEMFKGADRT